MDKGTVINNALAVSAIKELLDVKDEGIATKAPLDSVWVVLPSNGTRVLNERFTSAVMGRSNGKGLIDIDDIKQLLTNIRLSAGNPNYEAVDILPDIYRYGEGRTSKNPPYNEKSSQILAEAKVHSVPVALHHSHLQALEGANVTAIGCGVAPHAASKLIALSNDVPEAYLLIDLGGSSSTVSFIGENNLYQTLSLPYGMNNLTEEIAKSFEISYEEAERVKKTYGYYLRKSKFNAPIVSNGRNDFYQIDLNSVIKRWFTEFNLKFKGTVNAVLDPILKKNNPEAQAILQTCPAILIGGGSNLLGIEELIQDALGSHKGQRFIPNVVGARDAKYANILGLLVAKCTSTTPIEEPLAARTLSRSQN